MVCAAHAGPQWGVESAGSMWELPRTGNCGAVAPPRTQVLRGAGLQRDLSRCLRSGGLQACVTRALSGLSPGVDRPAGPPRWGPTGTRCLRGSLAPQGLPSQQAPLCLLVCYQTFTEGPVPTGRRRQHTQASSPNSPGGPLVPPPHPVSAAPPCAHPAPPIEGLREDPSHPAPGAPGQPAWLQSQHLLQRSPLPKQTGVCLRVRQHTDF